MSNRISGAFDVLRGRSVAVPMPSQPQRHVFIPSYGNVESCGFITEGATWTVADPYYCNKPPTDPVHVADQEE